MEHISNQLALIPNQEPVKQDLQPQKNTEQEEKFVQAIEQGKPIKVCPLEELKKVLRMIFVKVGLRAANFPKAQEKEVLHHHIVSNYGGHTAKEILLAFEMGMQGKLENLKGEVLDMAHYENFSCLYFSTVMNAYRQWAKVAANQHEKNFRKNMIEHGQIEETTTGESMSDQTYQDWLETTAKDYKAAKTPSIDLLPVMIADWLVGKGKIDHTEFFKRAAIMIGKKLAAASETDKGTRVEYHEFKQQYENAVKKGEPFTGKWPKQIERLAKQIALNNYILETDQGKK